MGGCIRSVDELSVDVLPIDRVTKPYVICFISPQDTVPEAVPLEGVSIDSTVSRNPADAALTTYTTALSWTLPAGPTNGKAETYYRGWAEVDQEIIDATTGLSISRQLSRPSFYVDRAIPQVGGAHPERHPHAAIGPENRYEDAPHPGGPAHDR